MTTQYTVMRPPVRNASPARSTHSTSGENIATTAAEILIQFNEMLSTQLYGMIPCQTVRYMSIAGGATVAYMGLDATLPLPKWVHYAAGGLVPEVAARMQGGENRMQLPLDYEGACAAAYGFLGALAVGQLLGRGPTLRSLY